MLKAEILAAKTPEDLFICDRDAIRARFRELALAWHPDRNRGNAEAAAVFKHVGILYEAAIDKLESGYWDGSKHCLIKFADGSRQEVKFLVRRPFELGSCLVGSDHVTWLVDAKHKTLVENFVQRTKFNYATDSMKNQISKCLPQNAALSRLSDGRFKLSISKTPEHICLRDVMDYYRGSIDHRHARWVMSTAYNTLCYLSVSGLVHHDISPDSYFIHPELHEGALLGGWFHAKAAGQAITSVPTRTAGFLPWRVRTQKIASSQTDLDLIRALGREMIGNEKQLDMPDPFRKWLGALTPEPKRGMLAISQYGEWLRMLDDCEPMALRGPSKKRKFVVLDLTADMVYK